MPTIGRLLVANRSEIAVRVFRACKELGITSIAIYSEIDRDAFHLGFADEAYYVGETPAAESYLNIGRIIEAARKGRADGVHPGYGFLAENPTFAQTVLDAGLIWVGPPPAAIRAMGDKVSARKVAGEAGVPTVPGTLDPASGPEDIESPSPVVDPDLRAQMGAAAVKLCRHAGYFSVGTAEFLLEEASPGDKTGEKTGPRFYFLELNTRLQVEHPVTELVSGLDLVKEMIWVAEGRPLHFTQEEASMRGHAIECRINAEDPARNFMPSPGTITEYREPAGPGIRVDAGAGRGTTISEFYDSLIAKLICYGANRTEAIQRMRRALDEYRLEGVTTTIPFHRLVAGAGWFERGEFSTSTVETSIDLSGLATGAPRPGEGRARDVTVELSGKRFAVRLWERPGAHRNKPQLPEPGARGGHAGVGETITAPMQGTILRVLAEEGATVVVGAPILVLEAMKMENLIVAHRDGQVKSLKVKAGDSVQLGAPLAIIGPPD